MYQSNRGVALSWDRRQLKGAGKHICALKVKAPESVTLCYLLIQRCQEFVYFLM